uniref:DDE-1 domain-containing protein n=1 Tax=Heterorhabditis bacteriophora TaxID=37862 RepID=A0A1I7WI79_HETBA
MTGNYRVLLADGAGVHHALNRQNAIRRLGNATGRVRAVAPASQLFDRLFDLGVHINRDRPLIMSAGRLDGTLIDSPEDRRLRQPASAPSALDRMTEGAAMIDALSLQYIAVIMNTYITRAAKKRVEEEKAKEAAEQAAKKAEEGKSASSASGSGGVAETATVYSTLLYIPYLISSKFLLGFSFFFIDRFAQNF